MKIINKLFRQMNLALSIYLSYFLLAGVSQMLVEHQKGLFNYGILLVGLTLFSSLSALYILVVAIDTFKIPTDWDKGYREFIGKALHLPALFLIFCTVMNEHVTFISYPEAFLRYAYIPAIVILLLYILIKDDWKRVQRELKAQGENS